MSSCKNKKHKIPKPEEINKNQETLKAIADPTRLKILYLLQDGELCVCQIHEGINKSQSTISHHLNILKKAEIIKMRKEGIWNYYSLSNPKLIKHLNKIFKGE